MSSADLYEDGYPHGTIEGYDRGCRGTACPGGLELGITCSTAKTRYSGDYHFRKQIDAGMTPAEIVAAEKAAAAAVAPKPKARPKPPAPTPVAADLAQWPDETEPVDIETEPAADATEPDTNAPESDTDAPQADIDYDESQYIDPRSKKPIPLDEHGTHQGYWHGCRDINCPGVQLRGQSCRKAINGYQREKHAARRAEAVAAREQREAARAAKADAIGKTVAEDAAAAPVDIVPAPPLSDDELLKVEAFSPGRPKIFDADLMRSDAERFWGIPAPTPTEIAINVPEIPALAEGGYVEPDEQREPIGSTTHCAPPAAFDPSAWIKPEVLEALAGEEPIEDILRRALWEAEALNRELRAQLRDAETSREVEAQRVVIPDAGGRRLSITITVE